MFAGAGNAWSWKIKVFIGEFVGGTYGTDWRPQPIPVEKFPKFLGLLVGNVCIAGSLKTFLSLWLREQVIPDLEKAQFSIGDFEDGCHCLTADYTKKWLLCPKLYNSFFASLSMSKPLSMKVLEVYCNFCGSGDGWKANKGSISFGGIGYGWSADYTKK